MGRLVPVRRSSLFAQFQGQKLLVWLDRHGVSESGVIMLTALLVGAGGGFGAVVFRWLIQSVQTVAYDGLGSLLSGLAPYHLLIIPALGGAIFGPLIYYFAREAKGHGVPEVMAAVALNGGRIRPMVAVIKSLASAICIGTGGSVGREGPIAQIGSALGSTIGQILKLSDERIRNLVACGAGAGIAATFNTPIAGAIFALEIILGQLHVLYFGAVVIAAVTADVIAHIFIGEDLAFIVPAYTMVSPWELVLYALMGIIAALAAVTFTKLLYLSEDLWERFRFPEMFKPVLGGLLLGVVGISSAKINGFPRVFGVGYESISQALLGQLALQMSLILLAAKLLATIITLGSGGSGGVFAPSLFMGALLGDAFGQIVNHLFPAITAPPGAYALVGMAAFFSGAAHAPVTAIIILFEMTRDYRIILPLMLTTVISTIVSRIISRESIYTLKLSRRGIHLEQGQDVDVMQNVTVGEVMTTDIEPIPMHMSLEELADRFERTHHHGFPVVDGDGNLVGVVTLQDLERAKARVRQGDTFQGKTVADIATMEDLLVVYPHDMMWKALRLMGTRDLGRLPVVEEEGSRKLVGVVRRSDIVRAYTHAITKRAHEQHWAEVERLGRLDSTSFEHIELTTGSPAVGKRVGEIALPKDCLIVSVRRGRKLYIPHGDTRLQVGDKLVVFANHDCVAEMRRNLLGENI